MTTPRVSLCLPTFNRGPLFKQTLLSLVAQTFRDVEIIVIDNASDSDEARRAVESVGDARVRYLRQVERVPMGANWNRGLAEARGEYVSICHDDDVYHPGMVAVMVARLDADPSLAFVHAMTLRIDEEAIPLGLCDLGWPEFVTGAAFRHRMAREPRRSLVEAPSVVARATAVRAAGPFRADLVQDTDAEMWMRLARHGNVGYVRKPLVNVRLRIASIRPAVRHVRSLEERFAMLQESGELLGPAEKLVARARLGFAVSECLLWMVLRGDEETTAAARERIIPRLSAPLRVTLRVALSPRLRPPLLASLERLAGLRRRFRRVEESFR